MRRSTRTTRAFTLIELMVVISIIALLMSILLPALSQAREATKTVQCLSNMRQIGIAVSAYATDEDSLPLMDRVTGSGWSTSQQYRLAPYLGGDQNSMWGGKDSWLGLEENAPDRMMKVFQCPNRVYRWANPNPANYRHGKMANYASVERMFPRFGNNGVFYHPVEQRDNLPNNHIMWLDSLGYGTENWQTSLWNRFLDPSVRALYNLSRNDLHVNLSTNFLYTDMHAESHALGVKPGTSDTYINGEFRLDPYWN